MKKILYLYIFAIFIFSSNVCFAELNFSEKLCKDVFQTYGYYIGQNNTLTNIEKKYPNLKPRVIIAKQSFLSSFGDALTALDTKFSNIDKKAWDKFKKNTLNELRQTYNFSPNYDEAVLFLEEVENRAQGNLPSPIFETLLLFKPQYEKRPELEFLDGYTSTYTSSSHPKAKGVNFSIRYPKTWTAQEGKRPNIVQKFSSLHQEGAFSFAVLIKNIPEFSVLHMSKKDLEDMVDELVSEGDYTSFISENSEFLGGGKIVIEMQPGFWVHFIYKEMRGRLKIVMESIAYMIFYKDKFIILQGIAPTTIDGKPFGKGNFKKNQRLFEIMANSFVLHDVYGK